MSTDRLERARNILFDGNYADGPKMPSENVPIRTSFTINEVKKMKHDLEKQIASMLLSFCEATGTTIDYINVDTVEDFSGSIERYRVSVEAKL